MKNNTKSLFLFYIYQKITICFTVLNKKLSYVTVCQTDGMMYLYLQIKRTMLIEKI